MNTVVVLAVIGLVAVVIAALTGSTPLAVIVIALAVAGIVQLLRDWRRDPKPEPARDTEPAASAGEPEPVDPRLFADDFSPDISTDPDGPSSDARSDQT